MSIAYSTFEPIEICILIPHFVEATDYSSILFGLTDPSNNSSGQEFYQEGLVSFTKLKIVWCKGAMFELG